VAYNFSPVNNVIAVTSPWERRSVEGLDCNRGFESLPHRHSRKQSKIGANLQCFLGVDHSFDRLRARCRVRIRQPHEHEVSLLRRFIVRPLHALSPNHSTLMADEDELKKLSQRVVDKYGGRSGFLFHVIQTLAMSGQPCDVCTYSGGRYLDVRIDPDFIYALMYGAGAAKLAEMLNDIKLQPKTGPDVSVGFNDIWVVNPMPKEGFTPQQLAEVDLKDAERKAGPQGETIREMIRNSYHPKDDKELEHFVRRFLAS
jgi:hypothetical protein